ncbi:restriction endonuclease subunit S [Campylobacter sp. RM9929]|uniref:restriction endonuclease subunit S n=1 Tax=Campylobacter molothri TaxID=1032242 RepID=UPI001DADCEB1|nr:restriction endonuclease subunit S [Campylobacter sp. RM9929]
MKIVPKGTLLMSFKLTLGKTAFAGCDLYTNEAIAAIFIKDKNINKYFLDYALKFTDLEKYVDNAVKGKTLNKQKLRQIEIPIPPLKEQERIVGILDESFAKIDESIKILEQDLLNLDELMQSALQKAFNPLKDDTKENYQLPQGWEIKKLDDIAEIQIGKTPSRNNIDFFQGENIWLSIRDLKSKFVSFSSEKISNEAILKTNMKIVPKGTLLMSFKLTLGKTAFAGCDLYTNEAIAAIFIKDKNINKYFLDYALKFTDLEKYVDNAVKGKTLNKQKLRQIEVPIPPLKEQEQIASYLDELSLNIKALKENYKTQIKDYEELKKSLLKKAFEGRL